MNKEITIASVGNEHIEKFLSEERDLFYTLLERIIALTAIHPMYTYEHNNTEFSNGLSFKKYQIWNSSNAIDEMIKRKMRITEYIQIVPKKMQGLFTTFV